MKYLLLFVFAEFTREVTDTQMPLVAPVILPEMYKIFTMAEVWNLSPVGAAKGPAWLWSAPPLRCMVMVVVTGAHAKNWN